MPRHHFTDEPFNSVIFSWYACLVLCRLHCSSMNVSEYFVNKRQRLVVLNGTEGVGELARKIVSGTNLAKSSNDVKKGK